MLYLVMVTTQFGTTAKQITNGTATQQSIA